MDTRITMYVEDGKIDLFETLCSYFYFVRVSAERVNSLLDIFEEFLSI